MRYVLTANGTLHKMIDGMSHEADNLDSASYVTVSVQEAEQFFSVEGSIRLSIYGRPRTIRRACKRCFKREG